ncbi:MAG TPA: hypothetical protein VKG45_01060 [Actinomycetes bacterium]|nr:hypothetical protein [Actinomycetes bacterium]
MVSGDGGRDPGSGAEGVDRPQDEIVSRLRPDPAQPPTAGLTFSGFLGDSDRPGFRRLYFTRDLDSYAEFRVEDVLHVTAVPASAEPFVGDEATRLTLRRDAAIDYTRTRSGRPIDEFDLNIRLADPEVVEPGGAAPTATLQRTCIPTCVGGTCDEHDTCLHSACHP